MGIPLVTLLSLVLYLVMSIFQQWFPLNIVTLRFSFLLSYLPAQSRGVPKALLENIASHKPQ